MRQLALSILAIAVSASLYGCSSRVQGAQRKIPARPKLGEQIERAARALTGNALLGPLAPDSVSNRLKEAYNRAAPSDWPQFSGEIQATLGLYDGFDGKRGNQWLVDGDTTASMRYHILAKVLADDRIWVNSASTLCTRYLAVELAELANPRSPSDDCGGRTPNYDAVDVFRSLLINGTITGVDDGVARDDHVHSSSKFPFLAAP